MNVVLTVKAQIVKSTCSHRHIECTCKANVTHSLLAVKYVAVKYVAVFLAKRTEHKFLEDLLAIEHVENVHSIFSAKPLLVPMLHASIPQQFVQQVTQF